jgi:GT2 family glycosyltransferase/predicted Zn-dependent protease
MPQRYLLGPISRVLPEQKRSLQARVGQAVCSDQPEDTALAIDLASALVAEPQAAWLHHALGLVTAATQQGKVSPGELAQTAAAYFRRAVACDPTHIMAGLNLTEALAASGQRQPAVEEALRTLRQLDEQVVLNADQLNDLHFPLGLDAFRVEWERAALSNAGRPQAEAQAKTDLVRWRLQALLGNLTDAVHHYYEAAVLRPDLPSTRAALGCALARAKQFPAAVPHLRYAVAENPFDGEAARALYQALGDSGDSQGQRRVAAERRLRSQADPQIVPAEAWFMDCPPPGDELASILILCCNELHYTRLCLESVLRHTRPPYELVVVDNGSTDGTPAYLEEVRTRTGPAHVTILRNETNVGFPAGCNQALAAARGQYLVFLNNDTIVTEGWLNGLVGSALREWPRVGLVGPVSNSAPPPQHVAVSYADIKAIDSFAARRKVEYANQALEVDRLTGFCLLVRRDVLDRIGGFDERYGLGFFDDDDLCVRAREAGFRLLVAPNIFIHHFGSRTFTSLGIDCEKQLVENFRQFKEKWGPERAAGYRRADGGEVEARDASTRAHPLTPGPSPPEYRGRGEKNEAEAELVPNFIALPAAVAAPNGAKKRVSLCMMVKNEEKNLPACLESAADLVDEIVVVDTGSTDKTKQVAERLGARVYDFTWVDSFAAARNASLHHATGDWIFWLDADDRVDETNRQQLRKLFQGLGNENVAYSMKCRCLTETPGAAATVVDHLRLFRNHPDMRWKYRVHEQIMQSVRRLGGAVVATDIVIHHVGYEDPSLRVSKEQRNLRLLLLDHAEDPNDPFTLFNLGWTYSEMGQPEEALSFLRGSLERSHPNDSIVRKLYAIIMSCLRKLGRRQEALAVCTEGRRYYPDDAQLLFDEAGLRRDENDFVGAEACLLQLMAKQDGPHFASVAEGLRGYLARHNLAVIYREQGRFAEAEAQWRAAAQEQTKFTPARFGLAELYLIQNRFPELEEQLAVVEVNANGSRAQVGIGVAALKARAHIARHEYAAATGLLEEAISHTPREPHLWEVLSHALLQEGKDPVRAERSLRTVLELQPDNVEARRNLDILLRGQERGVNRSPISVATLADLYDAACTTPSDIHEHCPLLHGLAKTCRHVTEFGTRTGVSTAALLFAQPDKLVCYDQVKFVQVDLLARLAGRTTFVFHQANVLEVDIEETDLLFIDTWHVYDQLQDELRRHAGQVRRYLVLHDTTTFGERGEAPDRRGLWPAIEEFLALGTFRLQERLHNNNGLTVLEAVPSRSETAQRRS